MTAKKGLQVPPSIGVREPAQPHQKRFLSGHGDALAAPNYWNLQGLGQNLQVFLVEAELPPEGLLVDFVYVYMATGWFPNPLSRRAVAEEQIFYLCPRKIEVEQLVAEHAATSTTQRWHKSRKNRRRRSQSPIRVRCLVFYTLFCCRACRQGYQMVRASNRQIGLRGSPNIAKHENLK